MSNLLYLPGILVILFKRRGAFATLRHLAVMLAVQGLLGYPFLMEYPWEYLAGAFDLSRMFLYKWTVNWRFVDEITFLSPRWSKGLLIGHLCTLVAFGMFRWCRKDGGVWKVLNKGIRNPLGSATIVPITPDCGSTLFYYLSDVLILRNRRDHSPLHFQPCWNTLCSFTTLPILFLVCSANPSNCVEDALSYPSQVDRITPYTSNY